MCSTEPPWYVITSEASFTDLFLVVSSLILGQLAPQCTVSGYKRWNWRFRLLHGLICICGFRTICARAQLVHISDMHWLRYLVDLKLKPVVGRYYASYANNTEMFIQTSARLCFSRPPPEATTFLYVTASGVDKSRLITFIPGFTFKSFSVVGFLREFL